MLQLRDALEVRGFEAVVLTPEQVRVVIPVEYREVAGELDALVSFEGERVVLDLFVPVLRSSIDSAVGGVVPPVADVDCFLDTDSDDVRIVAAAVISAPIVDLVVHTLTPRVRQALSSLLDAGLIDVADASEDATIEDVMHRLPGLKAIDPRGAVELAAEGAERCRALGDASLGSFLEVAAAEVLLGLGDIHGAAKLAEPAWRQLEEPVGWREVVSVVAQLRARQGRLADAIALIKDAVKLQEDDFDSALLEGDLGVLLARAGRRVEASRLLGAAANDPRLDDEHRSHFREQLWTLRSAGGGVALGDSGSDATDAVDGKLNEIAALLLGGDRRALAVNRPRLDQLVGEVAEEVDRLGPAQEARLAMAEGSLAVLDGQPIVARRLLDRAVLVAEKSGDVELARSVRDLSMSLLDPIGSEPSSAASPIERLASLLNRALAELPTDMRRAQASAIRAIELVDRERHRYVSVADRLAWAELAARVYEIGVASSLALGDDAEVIEVLERARAQGAPADAPKGEGAVPLRESDEAVAERGREVVHLLNLTREALGDRPVAQPVVASVRAAEQPTDAVRRVDLDTVASGIAGGATWWWSSHIFGERIYWAVRSPSGATWTGANVVPGGPSAVSDLAGPFRSVASEADVPLHPLLGDKYGRRDLLLADLARAVLPQPLADAVEDAMQASDPIRLVWSAPRELARLPVGMLPVGDGVLLDGAILVMAPPTSLAVAGAGARPELSGDRPVILVLGGDADLGMLADFAGSISTDALDILGAARHVRSGIAGAMATPEAVMKAFHANVDAVAVYFGHVDEDGPSSQSAALSLTDGVRRATLDAARLLTPERLGAPHVVVLAGCSSLSAHHLGSGEWWGLATALLWQGARHVVGSMWDLFPSEATQALVADLTRALRSSDDPALVLRAEQLRHREQWLRTGSPLPYEWAGWSLASVGRGTGQAD